MSVVTNVNISTASLALIVYLIFAQPLTAQQVATFERMSPEIARTLKEQYRDDKFPGVADKIEAAMSSLFPLLQKNALSGGDKAVTTKFLHDKIKFRIEYKVAEDGTASLSCIGGKLAAGGNTLVQRMVQLDIPKNLQESNAQLFVYYKPIKEDSKVIQLKKAQAELNELLVSSFAKKFFAGISGKIIHPINV